MLSDALCELLMFRWVSDVSDVSVCIRWVSWDPVGDRSEGEWGFPGLFGKDEDAHRKRGSGWDPLGKSSVCFRKTQSTFDTASW
jgi:hypothetical protein